MEDSFVSIKQCRHCGGLITINDNICRFCNEITTFKIPKEIENYEVSEVSEKINNALIKMELFFSGKRNDYVYFGFGAYFEKLYYEMINNTENLTIENQNILDGYFRLLGQIYYDFDKGIYKNEDVYRNKDLYNDISELGVIFDDIYRFNILYPDNPFDDSYNIPRYTIFDLNDDLAQEKETTVQQNEIKYTWKSTHALNEFYKSVNNNFFEELDKDIFFNVFTQNNKLKLNAINYNQTDIGYLLDMIKPYFIEKIQAKYLDYISEKISFNGIVKNKKAVSEILLFHKSKDVHYKEAIDKILTSLKPFNT